MMPTLYLNNGLRIYINYREKGHNIPHVHAVYRDEDAAFDFDGNRIEGKGFPRKIEKEIRFYIRNHREFLESHWRGEFE